MRIQSVNQSPALSFGKLIVKPGSFQVLKQSKYFPDRSYPEYNKHLMNFYKQLLLLKKQSESNNLYNVVIKPDSKNNTGKVVIENSKGVEQTGFATSFEELLRVPSMEPKHKRSKKQEPSFIKRFIHNEQVRRSNKKLTNKQLKMDEFLNVVYKNIQDIIVNADYLSELQKLKQK